MKDSKTFFGGAHLFVIGLALALFFIGNMVYYKQVFHHNAHAWLDYAPGGEQFAMAPEHDQVSYAKLNDGMNVTTTTRNNSSSVDMLAGLRLLGFE